MGEIYEIIPIAAGAILAFIFARYRPSSSRVRWGITAVVSVAVGLTASIVSGEIHNSWAFVILDSAQAAPLWWWCHGCWTAGRTAPLLRQSARWSSG